MKFVRKSVYMGIAIAGTFAMSACVSSSKHKAEVGQLNSEIDKEKAQNADLTKQQAQLEEKLIATAKDRGQLKTSLDDMKKAMEEMRKRQTEERKRLQEFQDLTARFKKLTDSGTLSVRIIDGKMVVSLGSDVLFQSGSARLSAAGMDAIKEVSAQLAAISGKRYQIEGHTDNVPIATAVFPSNWELASARALNVTKAMIDAGMPTNRVSAASFGDTSPVQSNDTAQGKAANRRIAIVVVPDLSSLPGYAELNKMSTEN
jgi:chemotaxis protein MotB